MSEDEIIDAEDVDMAVYLEEVQQQGKKVTQVPEGFDIGYWQEIGGQFGTQNPVKKYGTGSTINETIVQEPRLDPRVPHSNRQQVAFNRVNNQMMRRGGQPPQGYMNRDLLEQMLYSQLRLEKYLKALLRNQALELDKERGRTYTSPITIPAGKIVHIDFVNSKNGVNTKGMNIRSGSIPFSRLVIYNAPTSASEIYYDVNTDQNDTDLSSHLGVNAATEVPSSYPSIRTISIKSIGGNSATVELLGIV